MLCQVTGGQILGLLGVLAHALSRASKRVYTELQAKDLHFLSSISQCGPQDEFNVSACGPNTEKGKKVPAFLQDTDMAPQCHCERMSMSWNRNAGTAGRYAHSVNEWTGPTDLNCLLLAHVHSCHCDPPSFLSLLSSPRC